MNALDSGSAAQTIGQLQLWQALVEKDSVVRDIQAFFEAHPEVPACIIRDAGGIFGLLSHKRFLALLLRPFGKELFIKHPIEILLQTEVIDPAPLILPADTPIARAVQIVLSRPGPLAHEPLLVTGLGPPRILEVDVLLRAQSLLLQQMIGAKDLLLQEVRQTADELASAMRDLERTRDGLLRSEERLEAEVARRTEELRTANAELVDKQQQIEEELKVARSLQQSILPAAFPVHDGFQGHAFMRAARMIGGDFYDIFQLDGERLGIVVADISGKGVPAALFMVLVRSVFQELASRDLPPSACMREANRTLIERNPLNLFVTAVYGVLDTQTGVFTFCNGGHQMPYILRADGVIEQVRARASPLVGLLDAAVYRDLEVRLEPGDGLVLVTDGVAECFNREGEAFGEERLLCLLAQAHSDPVDRLIALLIAEIDRFSEGTPASDDVTALALRYVRPPKVLAAQAPA
jgi:serine phosphatase RsbU (regulator of sigma subunit)